MTIAVVQTATAYDPPSGTCSFSKATTAGNCVVVFIFTYALSSQTITTTGCTLGGSAGNFQQAVAVQTTPVGGDTDYLAAWFDPNCAGGQTAVVANVTNATWQGQYTGTGLIIMELSGVAASSALDVTSKSSPGATGSTASSGSTAGTSVAGELALGAVVDAETFTGTDSSYTNITMGSPIACIAGYMPVPSAGTSVSYSAPANVNNVVAGIVFTLKPAGTAPAPPVISTTSLPAATTGTTYSATLAATGGTTPYTWSISAGTLPAGITLSSAGALAGTPTAAGTSSFTVRVTDAASQTATAALSITVSAVVSAPVISTTSLPAATMGTAYTAALGATGGTAPYTWSVTGGALPSGLSLSSAGVISGTPTAAGTVSFTVQVTDSASHTASQALSLTTSAAGGGTVASFTVEVTDSGGNVATRPLTLTVNTAATTLAISSASLPAGIVSTAYSATLTATGGTAPYTWAVSGLLPAGLSLNSSTGVISGTPTTPGTASFSVGVNDSAGHTATRAESITVSTAASTLTITTTLLSAATVSTAYSATLTATGGSGTGYTWTLASGTLPAGLALTAATGVIAGTPTTAGTSTFTVRVTDSAASTASQALSLLVNATAASLAITTTTLPGATAGTAYSATLAATGDSGYTWTVSSGTLPAGLALSSAGVISGTPTTAGSSSFTVKVTDSAAATATQALTLTVAAGVTTSTNPVGPTGTWNLVFNDEFPGTSLNTSNWTALQGASINNVSTSASAVSVSGGYLRIGYTGAVNSNPASGYAGPSSGPVLPANGSCVEASINFPNGNNWSAWWTDATNWPSGGEIDIAEILGGSLTALNYHSPSGANNGPTPGGNWYGGFHTYTAVRTSNSASVWWDGTLMRTVSTNDNGANHALIINMGSGGSGSTILVAYVRVWSPG